MKSKTLLSGAFLAILLFAATSLFAAGSPVGKWKTIDDETKKAKSYVEIYEKGESTTQKLPNLLVKPRIPNVINVPVQDTINQ